MCLLLSSVILLVMVSSAQNFSDMWIDVLFRLFLIFPFSTQFDHCGHPNAMNEPPTSPQSPLLVGQPLLTLPGAELDNSLIMAEAPVSDWSGAWKCVASSLLYKFHPVGIVDFTENVCHQFITQLDPPPH